MALSPRYVSITGTGQYLPERKVTATEVARKIGVNEDWVLNKTAIHTRYYADPELETISYMGAQAARLAIKNAGISFDQVDCIISACGIPQQPIPATAAFFQKELGLNDSSCACIDINTTCLSFVSALDLISYLIGANRFKCVLIISSDNSSVGLNWKHKESACLFGDGAAAAVVQKSHNDGQSSSILSSRIETFSEGISYAQIQGGCSRFHARHYSEGDDRYLFHMEGQKIYKLASKKMPQFLNHLLEPLKMTMSDIDHVIPHQASALSLKLLSKKLKIDSDKLANIVSSHGNCIAASIPMALHQLIEQNRLKRGQNVMLLGSAAGLTLGGMVLKY